MRILSRGAVLFILICSPVPAQIAFEPENYASPSSAWEKDKDSPDKWNLWSTDQDAAKKWTGGTVFRSPAVKKDRISTEEGAPMLRVSLTGIPDGIYAVSVKFGRGLGFSLDGGNTWTNCIAVGGKIGVVTITGGAYEICFDDRYADSKSPGNCYLDCIYFTPERTQPAAAASFKADFSSMRDIASAGFSWWSRDNTGSAVIVAEGRGGGTAVKITANGEKDWAFNPTSFVAVTPGQYVRAMVWLRSENPKAVQLQVSARSKKNIIAWDISFGKRYTADGAWTLVESHAEIPPGCDEIYMRLVGSGTITFLADDLSLTMMPAPPPPAKKPAVQGYAQKRVEEKMTRALIAIDRGADVYLSWRLLRDDPASITFNVYRICGGETVKINERPISDTTDYIDTSPSEGASYRIVSIIDGSGSDAGETISYRSKRGTPYRSIRTGTAFQKAGIADLDGDGVYDFVVKQPGINYVDPCISCNYWKPSTNTYKLEAYTSDGRSLWTLDLGWSIELGIWYSPYVVFDLNGDGKAEVAVKTGEGDPRDSDGAVRSGAEYITILDGMTGKEITRAPWPTRDELGDYNYYSRNQLGIAYLDGKTPCLIVARGTYTFMKADAYQLKDSRLEKLWGWTTDDEGKNARLYTGQGQHNMHCVDLDGDGRDEVMLGSCVLDDNGSGLWSTGLGHCDQAYVGDIDPSRPGLEVFYGIEPKVRSNGMCLVDARTGKILWGYDKPTMHIHGQGFVSDIDPVNPGMECYGGERDEPLRRLWSASGAMIADEKKFNPGLWLRAVYWDADPQRELFIGGALRKFNGSAVYEKIPGTQVAWADILGDWREEMIVSDGQSLHIYATSIPASDRRVCLMQDPLYRNDVTHQTMGYPQVPTTSYCLGAVTSR